MLLKIIRQGWLLPGAAEDETMLGVIPWLHGTLARFVRSGADWDAVLPSLLHTSRCAVEWLIERKHSQQAFSLVTALLQCILSGQDSNELASVLALFQRVLHD